METVFADFIPSTPGPIDSKKNANAKKQQTIQIADSHLRNLYFGDLMSNIKAQDQEIQLYEEITNLDELKSNIENYLSDYNITCKVPMDLVIFGFLIEHVSRISRILKQQSNGHGLLIGIGGTGRSSATKLATFIADFELFQIEVSKKYSFHDWRADLKNLIRKSGETDSKIVFLLNDNQIKDDSFLEDINMVLNSGDVPSLFESDEKAEIVEKMQQISSEESNESDQPVDTNPISLYNKFIERVRSNLHIILAFSPLGESFRNQLRMFPALINCCTIDWFKEWPDDALELVAHKFLDDVEMKEQIREQTVQMCKLFHKNVVDLSAKYFEEMQRRNYVTPSSYLELLKTFKSLLDKKRFEILSLKERYVIGLEKLEASETQINIMQRELTDLQPIMKAKSLETEELIKIIEKEASEVDKVKQVVEADKERVNSAAVDAQQIKDECEEQLEMAMPALKEAVSALDTLKPQDISCEILLK